ncbi:hypothetical protein [Bacillus pseudomycoides]|uniref:hypothetical protein n=1 Tax=Bacillus pseudomycoides TaxID=64104 RepID=UPI000BEB9063|nr:hypothetical protein [Bacillus pseudomycoides]PEB42235.1 hypothetical protein COO06_07950 [Bacillus pseudomycoides]PGA62194.1 hypothetical protein COL84_13550 [Bacillus pseudomycoides]
MKKMREVYVCEICENACESNECYVCDTVSARQIPVEINKEAMMQVVREILNQSGKEKFEVMLSSFLDSPCDLAIIDMDKETILEDLNKLDFIFNDITSVNYERALKKCLGIGLLDPYKTVKGEQVTGLFIFTE